MKPHAATAVSRPLLALALTFLILLGRQAGAYAAQTGEGGIQFFVGTWEQVLAEAKKTGKPIFVDFYATWCGPCKTMASKTFANATVGDYANPRFIAYKVDCEKGQGVDLANKFAIEAYPTIIFFNADGTVKQKAVGYKDVDQFLALLKKNTPESLKNVGSATAPTPPGGTVAPGVVTPQPAPTEGIAFFQGTWTELLAEAKKTGKPFFVDFYTTWCGPCKAMANTTFKDATVGAFANANYLAYKVDCESDAGIPLAKQYKITAYPTILFFDANGQVIKKELGYMPAETFAEVLKANLPTKK